MDAGHIDPLNMKFSSAHVNKIRSMAANTYNQIDNCLSGCFKLCAKTWQTRLTYADIGIGLGHGTSKYYFRCF